MKFDKVRGAVASVLAIGWALGVPPVAAQSLDKNAQDAPIAGGQQAADATAGDTGGDDIVVTGSRIARAPNETSVLPITSISAAELTNTGNVAIGDQLSQLPAVRATINQANSSRFLGTAGLNLIDLRGLGPQRTLVLVNGRRHVAGDILSSGVATDVNTIPTDLLERVDIITGGDSAVYGSDAIAGVANFVLKDNFDGLLIRGQGGISRYGDAGAYRLSATAGHNFAGGRGNVAASVEYSKQDDFFATGRPTASVDGFISVDTDPSGTPNGSDGDPDRRFFRDIRSSTSALGGLFSVTSPTGACGRDKNAAAFNCTFIFQPDGSLVPQTGTRVGLAPNGSFIGGNGSSNPDPRSVGLTPDNQRLTVNAIGHFEISPAFVPFFEATWSHSDVLRSATPSFIQGSTLTALGGDERERPRLDNPYLSAQARALIASQIIASGRNPATNAALSAADLSAIADGSFRFPIRETLLGLGLRGEKFKRDTYRAVVGVRGEFNTDWHYEVSANYGEFREENTILNNFNIQRFLLANDVTRNAQGQIVCRSQIDPAAARALFPDDPVSAGSIANDVATCVPLNLFGQGNITPAAAQYVNQNTVSHGKITQFVASGYLSGDTSGFFRLPGGPIGFAAGAEYRRETNYYQESALVDSGLTFYNAIPTFTAPAFEVKEAFGEIKLPILRDVPFVKDLTLTAAGRVADYKGATGTVFAYNYGGEWAPISDIRFRANYSQSVRAPNLAEIYGAQGQNFTAAPLDPCSARNLGAGSSTRSANCTAAGRPANYDYVYTASLLLLSGGNPNLKQETGHSWTYGAVVQPRWIPGLTLSADYYNIKVTNVITSPSAQQILNSCYDAPNLNNQFCALFQRAGASGGPNGEEPFRIIEGSLQQTLLNYAKLQVRGLNVDLAYRRNLGAAEVSTHFIWTHVLQNDAFSDPTQPNVPDQILDELGDPQDSFIWNVGLKTGPVRLDYQMRYLSPMVIDFAEDVESVGGQPPVNADYADPARTPGVFYHNIRLSIEPTKKYSFYGGIDNFTDTKVPFNQSGVGTLVGSANTNATTGIFDNRGRYFYAGVSARF